jgi:hypothetical protein
VRENRTHGSEGGEAEPSRPLSIGGQPAEAIMITGRAAFVAAVDQFEVMIAVLIVSRRVLFPCKPRPAC